MGGRQWIAAVAAVLVGLGGTIAMAVAGDVFPSLKAPMFLGGAGMLAFGLLMLPWALPPRTGSAASSSPPTPSDVTTTPEYVRIKTLLGPTAAPRARLDIAYAEFNQLADRAEAGDPVAAQLALKVSEWLVEAARFYYASSLPYFRIERFVVKRLERLQNGTTTPSQPANHPDELERGQWMYHYDPKKNLSGAISFKPSGALGESRHFDVGEWRLEDDFLTLKRDGGIVNRFVFDHDDGRFRCTNEAIASGLKDQVIEHVRAVGKKSGAGAHVSQPRRTRLDLYYGRHHRPSRRTR